MAIEMPSTPTARLMLSGFEPRPRVAEEHQAAVHRPVGGRVLEQEHYRQSNERSRTDHSDGTYLTYVAAQPDSRKHEQRDDHKVY